MAETERDFRVTDDAPAEQTDDSRSTEGVVLTARLLANPRRVRRD